MPVKFTMRVQLGIIGFLLGMSVFNFLAQPFLLALAFNALNLILIAINVYFYFILKRIIK